MKLKTQEKARLIFVENKTEWLKSPTRNPNFFTDASSLLYYQNPNQRANLIRGKWEAIIYP